MSNLILSNCNTNNNNENGILEIGTGEILSDKRPNGKEKPYHFAHLKKIRFFRCQNENKKTQHFFEMLGF